MTTCIYEKKVALRRVNGKYVVRLNGAAEETPVTVKLARPLTGRDKEIAFIDEKKREIALIQGLHVLDEASREVAREALDLRYLIIRVTRVDRTRTHFGTRFWEVQTDRGPRKFAMKDPSRNVNVMDDGRMVLWDTLGNCYEIESFDDLDEHSRTQVERIV